MEPAGRVQIGLWLQGWTTRIPFTSCTRNWYQYALGGSTMEDDPVAVNVISGVPSCGLGRLAVIVAPVAAGHAARI